MSTVRSRITLRTQLLGIVALVALVSVALGAYAAFVDFSEARAAALSDTRYRARAAAQLVKSSLADSIELVETTIAESDWAGVFAAPGECALAGEKGSGVFRNGHLELATLDGEIFCSSLPTFVGAPVASWMTEIGSSGDPVVTHPYINSQTGKLSIAVAGAIRSGKSVIGGFAQVLQVAPVSIALGTAQSALDHTFLLADPPTGAILSPPAAGGPFLLPVSFEEQAGSWPGVDRVRRIHAGTRLDVEPLGWLVFAGIDESSALAAAHARLRNQAATGGIGLALLIALAVALSRKIVRPVARLTDAIEQAGREVTPPPLAVEGPSEIMRLVERFNEMVRARADADSRLEHHSLHDPLTGLPNRVLLLNRLGHALERSARRTGSVALLFFDVDRFKVLNEGLGHDGGDRVLTEIADRLRAACRPEDTVARFGGDEFLILCEDIHSPEQVAAASSRLRSALHEPFEIAGTSLRVDCSVGIALSKGDVDPQELVRDADAAMSRAKAKGGARHEFSDETMRAQVTQRLQLESDLQTATERGELRVHYQPIIDLKTDRVIGAEALLRWEHPTRGLMPPGEFIPLAEETGLITELGEFILRESCRQAAAWRAQGLPLRVSVNVSPRQLDDPDLALKVSQALLDAKLPPEFLCLEMTETAVMTPTADTVALLDRFRSIGVSIAIDDFGTGYSSLSYLRRFPISELKIDRSFIAGMRGEADASIVRAIIEMARALGVQVVAEGVEQPIQAAALKAVGCDFAQGFYYAMPKPAVYMSVFERDRADRAPRSLAART